MGSDGNKFGFVDHALQKGRYREMRSIAVLHRMVNGLDMNPFVTHTTKTLALLAILLLPVQRSMAATCDCHSGVGKASSGAMTSCCSQPGASCCSPYDLEPSCCQASCLDSKSRSEQCPGEYCEVAVLETVAPLADSSSGIDLSAAAAQSISTIADVDGPQNLQTSAVAINTMSGSALCVRLCRYRL